MPPVLGAGKTVIFTQPPVEPIPEYDPLSLLGPLSTEDRFFFSFFAGVQSLWVSKPGTLVC